MDCSALPTSEMVRCIGLPLWPQGQSLPSKVDTLNKHNTYIRARLANCQVCRCRFNFDRGRKTAVAATTVPRSDFIASRKLQSKTSGKQQHPATTRSDARGQP
jgi:hypothetical protein